MSANILTIAQLVLAALLTAAVLLQQKGSGVGMAFGGGSTIYSAKRGVDKFLFRATIVLSALFFGLGLLGVFLR